MTITKKITLRGRHGATIDATGQPYGIGIAADYVNMIGMTVINASPASDSSPADLIHTAGFVTGVPTPGNHGIILAAPIPNGSMHDNRATGNTFNGNGHAGVVAHAPGGNFSRAEPDRAETWQSVRPVQPFAGAERRDADPRRTVKSICP